MDNNRQPTKKTSKDFDSQYRSLITDKIFEHQKKYDEGMVISDLHKQISEEYEISRYKVESRARILLKDRLIEAKTKGVKAFALEEGYFNNRLKNPPALHGSGYKVEKERQKLDRAIENAIKKGMEQSYRSMPKSHIETPDEIIECCGVRVRNIIYIIRSNRKAKDVSDKSIRRRIDALIKKGVLIKGSHRSSGFSAVALYGFHKTLNHRARRKREGKYKNESKNKTA